MDSIVILGLTLGVILSLVHYYSDKITLFFGSHKIKLVSFSAGVSIAYFFLMLMPEIYGGFAYINKLIFVFILIGFVLFHLTEKFIYQHEKKDQLMHDLKEAHSLVFFFYHFIVALVLIRILSNGFVEGLLFFIPILFHMTITNVSLHEIHRDLIESKFIRFLLCLSSLIGIVFALFANISNVLYYTLFSFIGGAILYIVVREEIPKDKNGYPSYFILGAFIYSLLIVLFWLLWSEQEIYNMVETKSFENKVYEVASKIPKGKVATYKTIAKLIKKPKSYRAVGNALHNNPFAPKVPCHRVVN